MYDVAVIGAGLGGLMAAAKLARAGKRVVVLEKKTLPGGTSYIFRRGGYAFPMGPLSFSFPGRVRALLSEAGVEEPLGLRRSSFEVRTPGLDVVISRPLDEIEAGLARLYPGEAAGLDRFFSALRTAIAAAAGADLMHPGFAPGSAPVKTAGPAAGIVDDRLRSIAALARTPAAAVLDPLISSVALKNLLGSMGSEPPRMSMLNLALMWNVMSGEGIWSPDRGVHVLADLLRERFLLAGGELRQGTAVRRIVIEAGRAAGVVTAAGDIVDARRVVSNADYKTTFLELVDPADSAGLDLDRLRAAPYTDSELCVYLGLRSGKADLSAMRADHLFYRHEIGSGESGLEDFDRREIEICLWSRKAPGLVPPGRDALVLRAGFPYEHFASWRLAEKIRREGYAGYKRRLASDLVRTAERVLPGLSGAAEVMEAATPLTYRDWGGRFAGSIAGWSWEAGTSAGLPGRVLVRTPVPGLLVAGAYATTELVLGGVPTALFTGSLAADLAMSI
jgi:phytoene dehydrogenase-like protein